MSERLPFPTDLFRTGGPRGMHDDAEVIALMRLGDRGEYLAAAHTAAELLQHAGRDARLTAVYLAGSFIERGPAGLPELFECMAAELGGTARESPQQTRTRDAAVKWLCRALTSVIGFHTTHRGEVWQRWLTDLSDAQLSLIAGKATALGEVFPDCAGSFAKIGRWSQEKLAPAAARVRKAAAAAALPSPTPAPTPVEPPREPSWDDPEPELPEPELAGPADADEPEDGDEFDEDDEFVEHDDDDDEFEEDEDEDDGEFAHGHGFAFEPEHSFAGYAQHRDAHEFVDHRPPISRPMPGPGAPELRAPLELLSPPLAQLCDKLRGFERLVERGELDKAAIVASDIQAVIENFDPLVYLPSLFGRYFQLLSKVIVEVEARWNAGDSTARRVLEQFYRVDLDRFINDE